ncbi:hypothetical protein [Bacillus sp. FJAT-28004]|uniref:hypothetical protein n=1 Tax=Bacillus sp. FJAT-28004 TaxID=1679165 RepID=UPI0006B43867|nr:hypothetical protein [Bacillus sp. FJAT-28004]
MQNMTAALIIRKAIATFVVTLIASIIMAAPYVLRTGPSEFPYNLGHSLVGWSFIYVMYIGTIILIYGNAVSLLLEWARKKWFVQHRWLALLLHGVFGLVIYLLIPNWPFALAGMIIALAYGGLDWWLSVRVPNRVGILLLVLTPIMLYVGSWGTLQYISQPMPPFTIEDAVATATDGKGTDIDDFPNEIGRWHGMIDDYQVERTTSAEEIAKDRYIVTFTETWKKGGETNSRYMSYHVMRGSTTHYKSDGEIPPYKNLTLKDQSINISINFPVMVI